MVADDLKRDAWVELGHFGDHRHVLRHIATPSLGNHHPGIFFLQASDSLSKFGIDLGGLVHAICSLLIERRIVHIFS
jgi:hypothetical protein